MEILFVESIVQALMMLHLTGRLHVVYSVLTCKGGFEYVSNQLYIDSNPSCLDIGLQWNRVPVRAVDISNQSVI